MEKFVETERNTRTGGQKASRTRKSSGAVANFGVSGYFSHEKGGTWATSRMLPRKLPSPYCCRPARLTSPGCPHLARAHTAPTHQPIRPRCYSWQSGVCRGQQRCGSRPRAGRRRLDLAPPFHHRGLDCLGMPTAENLQLELGVAELSPAQMLSGEKRRPNMRSHAQCLRHVCICFSSSNV